MAIMNSGLGGAAGYGENTFSTTTKAAGSNDDGAVQVDITSVFGSGGINFFGTNYSDLYINSNGMISFGSASTSYGTNNYASETTPSIAALWSDININDGGEIYWDLDPTAGTVTITWDSVAPYAGNGENSFQVVITSNGGGDFSLDYIYEDIQWSNGGRSAIAGFSDGAGNVVELEGSGSPSALKDYESNDFGGGDAAGSFSQSFSGGFPADDTVTGTDSSDTITLGFIDDDGSIVSDVSNNILAGGGDDSVLSGAGDDTIYGGGGLDTIDGGAGNDTIYGDTDPDTGTTVTITASNFSDTSNGYTVTAQNVSGGALTTASVNNIGTFAGSFGADGSVSDTDSGVNQQIAYDKASGLSETLNVDFDDPVDTLSFSYFSLRTSDFSEVGHYAIYDGNTLVYETDFTDATGTGNGTIDVAGHGDFDRIVFTAKIQSDGSDGSDFGIIDITFTQAANTDLGGADSIAGGAGDDVIFGEAGGDTISGGDGDDYIDGGDGDDYLTTGLGQDTLIGGAGDDTLRNSAGDDSLVGGTGNDSIVATLGNDTLEGGSGDDTLDGGADDDSIEGGSGDDRILTGTGDDEAYGGDDADTFVIEDGFGNDTIVGGEGGTDYDTIDLSNVTGPVTVTYTGDEAGTITDGSDTISFSEIENLILTDQDDVVDASADSVGVDINAGDGDDSITGGSGADSLSGGAGTDNLTGGAGADTLDGGDGYDWASYYNSDNAVNVDLSDAISETGGDAEGDVLSNFEQVDGSQHNDTLTADDSGMQLKGWGGNDSLTGGSGGDSLVGGTGDDRIDGGSGDDTIWGDAGDDTVLGGDGDDSILGGSGSNTITGGDGNDTIVYGSGNDTITDFNSGTTGTLNDGDSTNNDSIDLSGYYDNLSELYADQADDGVLNQSNATDAKGRSTDYSDNTQFGSGSITMQGASADNSSFTEENTGVVCFTTGTAIRTPRGDVLIDELRVGDLVCTLDNGPRPVRWIGRREIGAEALIANPKLRPVLIPKGVIGAERNLLVSRQHALLINRDRLARAVHLTDVGGLPVRVANGKKQISYIHLMFDAHEIIFAENVPAESFYPGPMAIEMLDPVAREEMALFFPGFAETRAPVEISKAYGQTARIIAKRKEISSDRALMQRFSNTYASLGI